MIDTYVCAPRGKLPSRTIVVTIMEDLVVTGRKTGRPLSFDRDVALERAMLVFWRYGYETSSIVDLTIAMGITAPSLYAAFGDKKRLFLEAMRRYAGDPVKMEDAISNSPSARDAALELMLTAARTHTRKATPKGCLLASATASGSAASADVQEAVADVRRSIASALQKRIVRDVADGTLPAGTDANAFAGLVMAVNQGMSVLARDGAGRAHLLAIVDAALTAWPTPVRSA